MHPMMLIHREGLLMVCISVSVVSENGLQWSSYRLSYRLAKLGYGDLWVLTSQDGRAKLTTAMLVN
jgi:hypothetical protein